MNPRFFTILGLIAILLSVMLADVNMQFSLWILGGVVLCGVGIVWYGKVQQKW